MYKRKSGRPCSWGQLPLSLLQNGFTGPQAGFLRAWASCCAQGSGGHRDGERLSSAHGCARGCAPAGGSAESTQVLSHHEGSTGRDARAMTLSPWRGRLVSTLASPGALCMPDVMAVSGSPSELQGLQVSETLRTVRRENVQHQRETLGFGKCQSHRSGPLADVVYT